MAHRIYVYLDHNQGAALPVSWEAIGAARQLVEQLGGEVVAIVVGSQVEALANLAFAYGAGASLYIEDASLAHFEPERVAAALAPALADAELLLMPDTSRTRDLAGMLAVDLETAVAPDVTEFQVEGERLLATRPIYAGKLLAHVEIPAARPAIFTLRSRAFTAPAPDESAQGQAERLAADVPAALTEVLGVRQAEGQVSLTDAAIIVSGGRGMANNPALQPPAEITDDKEREIWRAHQGFKLVGDLASALGAAVGASRAAVDAGYVPYANQVGQTGKVVSPDLYIACGISGAIQHLAGMRTAKIIVAINTDPDAPIFKLCRFGVVGDLYEVLPALTEALEEKLEG
jgi:electron transfer flavoprotein alpha subunit